MKKCKIYGNSSSNETFCVREMMLGLREEFEYLLCGNCGCLQIVDIPSDLSTYYPTDYYSFSRSFKKASFFKTFFSGLRDSYAINKNSLNIVGKILNYVKPANSFLRILSEINLTKTSKILDVGSGNGNRILPLINAGFKIKGIDKYLRESVLKNGRLKIYKKDIFEVDGKWDVVMLNHVFEHLAEPLKVLQKVDKLLKKDGKCLLRIPIIPSYAWKKYRTDWVQIDAPRHLFIHSIDSLKSLLTQTNLGIEKIIYDSTPFQFLGSELYMRDISIKEGDFRLNEKNKHFKLKEIHNFIKKTHELNENKNGDQVAIIFSK